FDGAAVKTAPTLFFLNEGVHFSGTFDDQAALRITQTTSHTGTFRPEQPFTLPTSLIYEGDPKGRWGLLFKPVAGEGAGDLTGLPVNSWSLDFTVAEPTTQTDANGGYSFTGLAPGSYTVGEVPPAGAVPTFPANGATFRDVSVATDQAVSGIDFGIQ